MKRRSRLFTVAVLAAAILVACLCPASLPNLNPLNGIQGTLGSVASQMPKGALETVVAIGSQIPPGALETVQAQVPAGSLETVQAMATQSGINPGDMVKTAEAGAGGTPLQAGDMPKDIPIMEGANIQASTTQGGTYSVAKPVADVSAFYKAQMPVQGWKADPSSTMEIGPLNVLGFTKDTRKAIVTLTSTGSDTQVVIVINTN